MKSISPKVSVLIPVYNGASYVVEALESILRQTFVDFEALVIDDGSTDGTAEIVAACDDTRVQVVTVPENRGLVAALNLGLTLSQGEFIARMDADDISHPDRLARQVAFMEANASVGVCGSWMESFGAGQRDIWQVPSTHHEIVCRLLFESVLYHPTVIMRRELLDRHGLRYSSGYEHAEDYELWSRCSKFFELANLPEVLVQYRQHSESIGHKHEAGKLISAHRVREDLLRCLIGTFLPDEFALHCRLGLWEAGGDLLTVDAVHDWLFRLLAANSQLAVYQETAFLHELASRWWSCCRQSTGCGTEIVAHYFKSPLSKQLKLNLREKLVFIIRSFTCSTL